MKKTRNASNLMRGPPALQAASNQSVFGQGQQTQDVLAVAVGKKAEALAGAFGTAADAHMVQIAQAEAMNGEAAAADGTGDLVENVKGAFFFGIDGENARGVGPGRSNQADGTILSHVHADERGYTARATAAPPRMAAMRTASWTCSSPMPCCWTLASCALMQASQPARAAMARLNSSKLPLLVLGRASPCIRRRAGFLP